MTIYEYVYVSCIIVKTKPESVSGVLIYLHDTVGDTGQGRLTLLGMIRLQVRAGFCRAL